MRSKNGNCDVTIPVLHPIVRNASIRRELPELFKLVNVIRNKPGQIQSNSVHRQFKSG